MNQRIIRTLTSMKFAIGLLGFFGTTSVIGTLIPQNQSHEFYTAQYGPEMAKWIERLSIDSIYFAPWYLAIIALLCLSMLFCVGVRVGRIKRSILQKGLKNTLPLLGSWFLHVGIILMLLFFTIGNLTAFETTFYNVPGTKTKVEGTPFTVAIDDFQIGMREDKTVESYVTDARIFSEDGSLQEEGKIEVNHPIHVDGYQFSQTSYGFAVDTTVHRNGDKIGTALLYQGEFVTADSEKLIIEMIEFVDAQAHQSLQVPALSDAFVRYRLYYAGVELGVRIQAMDEVFTMEEYEITFSNPTMYSLITVRKDDFIVPTAIGAGLLIIGIFMTFFLGEEKKEERSDER